MAVETILGLPYLTLALLAVFWKYSVLPKIDWRYITAGALLFLLADMLGYFQAYVTLDAVQTALNALAALLVVIGALLNAVEQFKG